jgi:hypothetical protein
MIASALLLVSTALPLQPTVLRAAAIVTSQRRIVETLREKRWDIIEILVLPSVAGLDGT